MAFHSFGMTRSPPVLFQKKVAHIGGLNVADEVE